ncbi:acyl-CoA synthetase family protein [Pelagerythrobacter rhizovicinus]|uniref:Uncharacterized protein n=1 Tax=Pelagerythrobacter rhizovicinus TaxID=2268576 RepID=A0A4Q2KHK8_9SPHN|nr:hypothetical protein [Pelagerythrobacter rhizovicinus]RXZ64618.1 hypothetical protein ETX26_12090 [Pelagerythrobacter rhizovicinus]
MTIQFADIARATAADGEISAPHLLALRQLEWDAGRIGRNEAREILALNRTLSRPSGEWTDFFVETLSAHLLDSSDPHDRCSEEAARWLTGALDALGGLATMAELELLVRIIERTERVPETLRCYALAAIETAVLTGTGPTRVGGRRGAPRITGAECRLVRRILFADQGQVHAGPPAEEFLSRIDGATRGGDNSPEWRALLDAPGGVSPSTSC